MASGNDFLSDDCGQNALQLASRGSAIIAELLRLSEHIPSVFREPQKFPEYAHIVSDYQYFTMQDEFEKKIQSSIELLDRDEAFQQTHEELLGRFFRLFQGIYGYVGELNRFIDEIKDGMYISQSLESILVNTEGKQLLCEIFYLYGVMLLLLDYKIGGKTREYLVVSYLRYKGSNEPNTVEITQLCRNTGYNHVGKFPAGYPQKYFARLKVPLDVVKMLIGRIRSDDLYQMAYHYPAPEHRSTALWMQAAQLYVLLFFSPNLLTVGPVMREIVDKHFADNWVISYYMGFTVDLTLAWAQFDAASVAINGTVELKNVQYFQSRMKESLTELNKDVAGFLHEGVLTEQFVLDNVHSLLLPKVRDANVVLRWFILHMTRGPTGRQFFEKFKDCYKAVSNGVDTDDVLTLLLQTAQFEFILDSMFKQFLKEKRGKWEVAKAAGVAKMTKLATFFSGEHVLSDNVKVPQLEAWFTDIAERIESLDYVDATTASRKVQKLMTALDKVQEFHHIDSNLHVVQFVQETRQLLRQMIRYINIQKKVLITIATVGDLSYAWELFSVYNCFVPEIQRKIKHNPHLVIQMRSTFLKLATMLDMPSCRIAQATMNDVGMRQSLESVTEYYSGELVVFVRTVLHVIPVSIFAVLKEIISLQVSRLKELPTKVQKAALKDMAQPEVRHRLAQLTSEISKFADGILAMESTLVGVIQINPHQLLEDGVRKELVRQISTQLHDSLTFDPKRPLTAEEFDKAMENLGKHLQGMRLSFEYIQDYVNMHGLRIWLEEYWRIVNFNVEMECNTFMQKKLYPWLSKFQSEAIPIPFYEKANEHDAYSLLGRIVKHLLAMTDSRKTAYIPVMGSWVELATMKETVGSRTFDSIMQSVGSQGSSALDKLLCFIIAKDIQVFTRLLREEAKRHENILEQMTSYLTPPSMIVVKAMKCYDELESQMQKVWPSCTDLLIRIGRAQLLRNKISNELSFSSKLNSGTLHHSLTRVNEAILGDVHRHYTNPVENKMPADIVSVLTPFLESAGINNCFTKVYQTCKPFPELVMILLVLTIRTVGRLQYDERLATLMKKKKDDSLDAAVIAAGIVTILQQFHSDLRDAYFAHIAQYIRVLMADYNHVDKRVKDRDVAPVEATTMLCFVQMLAQFCDMPMDEFHRTTPPTLMVPVRCAPTNAGA